MACLEIKLDSRFRLAPLITPADRHGYSCGPGPGSSDIDILVGCGGLTHRLRRIPHIGELIDGPLGVAITRYRAACAASVGDDPAVADITRPWMDGMGYGIGLLGVARTQGDGVGALEVSIHLIVARQSVAGAERDDRK